MTSPHARPTWDDTWLEVSGTISSRSRCSRSRVGAVVVDREGNLVAEGYNGPPPGFEAEGTCDNWCPRARDGKDAGTPHMTFCEALHAEQNAILRAGFARSRGGRIYVTKLPCLPCARFIAAAGIASVMYTSAPGDDPARTDSIIDYFDNLGIEVEARPNTKEST